MIRYVAEKHLDTMIYAYWVRDLRTEETFGYGLTLDHAEELAHQLNQNPQ